MLRCFVLRGIGKDTSTFDIHHSLFVIPYCFSRPGVRENKKPGRVARAEWMTDQKGRLGRFCRFSFHRDNSQPDGIVRRVPFGLGKVAGIRVHGSVSLGNRLQKYKKKNTGQTESHRPVN
jgi:hypothetical protein